MKMPNKIFTPGDSELDFLTIKNEMIGVANIPNQNS